MPRCRDGSTLHVGPHGPAVIWYSYRAVTAGDTGLAAVSGAGPGHVRVIGTSHGVTMIVCPDTVTP